MRRLEQGRRAVSQERRADWVPQPQRRVRQDRRRPHLRPPDAEARPEHGQDAVPGVGDQHRVQSGGVLDEVRGTVHLAAPARLVVSGEEAGPSGQGRRRVAEAVRGGEEGRREELVRRVGVVEYGRDEGQLRVSEDCQRARWAADAARQIDYWVTTGPTPADIVSRYVAATGLPPMFPQWASGFWQSKLRYRDQDELLEVAREYKRRGLPLSVLVCDYFHWTRQGEWRFDPAEWPDPQAMVDELRELGVELMVSVWPTVNPNSDNYAEMDRRGLLVRNAAGLPLHLAFWDKGTDGQAFMRFYDSTNPEARRYIWEKVSDGYGRYGIRAFWLDACEPENLADNPEDARYFTGQGSESQGVYPREHARGFYEGLRASGQADVLLLCWSAWAGSQRYGAAVWSGDIESTFEALAAQVPAGLNMGISGIPWGRTDNAGFRNGDPAPGDLDWK